MQDLEIPPEEEGEADGGVAGVRPVIEAAVRDATARTPAASTALPWTTAIAPCWATITAINRAACARDFRPPTRRPIRNRSRRCAKTPIRASLPSSTTC